MSKSTITANGITHLLISHSEQSIPELIWHTSILCRGKVKYFAEDVTEEQGVFCNECTRNAVNTAKEYITEKMELPEDLLAQVEIPAEVVADIYNLNRIRWSGGSAHQSDLIDHVIAEVKRLKAERAAVKKWNVENEEALF